MEQLGIVTYEGDIESRWDCERDAVAEYVDTKPQEGHGRNSIDANGKWKIIPVRVFSCLDEKVQYDTEQAIKSALEKLTAEEKTALGIVEDSPESPDS